MLQEPFPDHQPDDRKPDGSGPAAESGGGPCPEDDSQGPEQGLFVCLPAEELSLAGFAQGGQADTMEPGAVAGHRAARRHRRGRLRAARSVRRPADRSTVRRQADGIAGRVGPDGGHARTGPPPPCRGAGRYRPGRVQRLRRRRTDGAVPPHLGSRDRADRATRVPSRTGSPGPSRRSRRARSTRWQSRSSRTRPGACLKENAAEADKVLAGLAQSKSFARLRYAAHRLVLRLEPDSAQRRKDEARKYAHVRRFREDTGNAGIAGREMPPDEVLASWQHVEQRALDLRTAGMSGTLQELRVRAFLDLLQETDSRAVPVGSADGGGADRTSLHRTANHPVTAPAAPAGPAAPDPAPDPAPKATPTALADAPVPTPSQASRRWSPSPCRSRPCKACPRYPARPAHSGLLDASDSRDVVAAAARHPRTRWCITALNSDGTAAAHGCAHGRHPPHGTRLKDYLPGLKALMIPVARGPCDHTRAEIGYHPSRKLAHLIRARSARCTAPGCSRPAARCDLDHTVPWDQGGLTCECNIAPLCRHHHRCKQAEGWRLEQPVPGLLVWHTPSGRTYVTTPTVHPM